MAFLPISTRPVHSDAFPEAIATRLFIDRLALICPSFFPSSFTHTHSATSRTTPHRLRSVDWTIPSSKYCLCNQDSAYIKILAIRNERRYEPRQPAKIDYRKALLSTETSRAAEKAIRDAERNAKEAAAAKIREENNILHKLPQGLSN